jgi:hypothetical protein
MKSTIFSFEVLHLRCPQGGGVVVRIPPIYLSTALYAIMLEVNSFVRNLRFKVSDANFDQIFFVASC